MPTNQNKHILFVLEYSFPHIGGVETLFDSLCASLVEKGYQVTVVSTLFDKSLEKVAIRKGYRLIRLPIKNRYFFTFFSIFYLLRLKEKFDLVHTTSYNAALPAWLFARIKNLPIVITIHEYWGKLWFQLPFISKFQAMAFFTFEWFISKLSYHKVIAVSEYTKNCLIKSGIAETKIERIYNGINYHVDANKKSNHNADSKTIIYFGRLGISKGLDILIPAFQASKKLFPALKLELVITKEPKFIAQKVKQLIAQNPEGIKVFHELESDELIGKINESMAVVIPSYSEGFCFAAVESVMLQAPIISSGKGALQETVSGKFIQVDNLNIEGLKIAIEMAVAGDWQRKTLRKFELDDSVSACMQLYENLLQESKKPLGF